MPTSQYARHALHCAFGSTRVSLCVMLVFIARVVVHAVSTVFVASSVGWRYTLYTPRQ